MTNDPANQREFTRVPVNLRAEVTLGGRPINCTAVKTLSMKGMLVESAEQLPEGTECEIVISLVEHEIEIQVLGNVVRNYPDSIAFQFTKILGVESYEHLRNLVLYNAMDVERVENEFETHTGIHKKDHE